MIDNDIEKKNTDIVSESDKSCSNTEKAEGSTCDSFQDSEKIDIEENSENSKESKDNENGFFGFFQKVGSDIGNGIASMFNQNNNNNHNHNHNDDKDSDIKSSEDK